MGDKAGPELEPRDVLSTMDRALVYVSKRQKRANQEVEILFGDEFDAVGAHDGDEFKYILDTLVERNLLNIRGPIGGRSNQFFRLNPEGWEKVDELSRSEPNSNQAFVAMWFTDDMRPALDDGFVPALKTTGFSPVRIDLVEHNDRIDDKIIAEIRRSALMVADFTGVRGGVYFEAGFAIRLNMPVIWTCREDYIDPLHFDTRQFNHIEWTDPSDLRVRLERRIAASIPGRATR